MFNKNDFLNFIIIEYRSLLMTHNKNQFIRNFIYITFCTLIIIVGGALTFYLYANDEYKYSDSKGEEELINYYEDNGEECQDDENGYFFGSLFFKFSAAFIAGSILSDKFFIKLGVIWFKNYFGFLHFFFLRNQGKNVFL